MTNLDSPSITRTMPPTSISRHYSIKERKRIGEEKELARERKALADLMKVTISWDEQSVLI